jgi:hypothetical protein
MGDEVGVESFDLAERHLVLPLFERLDDPGERPIPLRSLRRGGRRGAGVKCREQGSHEQVSREHGVFGPTATASWALG